MPKCFLRQKCATPGLVNYGWHKIRPVIPQPTTANNSKCAIPEVVNNDDDDNMDISMAE